jgi:hypothetical protein
MRTRLPTEFDFDGQQLLQVNKNYSAKLPSGDLDPLLPVRIVHFMQPFCSTYGVPTRSMLMKIQEERPLNTFIEFREAVLRKESGREATGKSVVGGWSTGLDRDLKDETFDLHGSVDEMIETGFEVICPFTKVSVLRNGERVDVLRMIGADQANEFEYYETLLRLNLDNFSNLKNTERLAHLSAKHEPLIETLMKLLEEKK